MSINFPANPVAGQIFAPPGKPVYRFDDPVWNILVDPAGPIVEVNNLWTPQMFGAAGDGVINDTVALQAWIDFLCANFNETTVSGSLTGYLPGGIYLATSLTITKPLTIIGAGPDSSVIKQVANHPTSLLNVRPAFVSLDYSLTGLGIAWILNLANLRLMGGDVLATQPNQNGLDFRTATTNPMYKSRAVLSNVHSMRFAGSGLYAGPWTGGWILADFCDLSKNALHGLYLNSISDYRFNQCNFYGNLQNGVLASGVGWIIFSQCNSWSNQQYGLYMFSNPAQDTNNPIVWDTGTIDYNQLGAVICDRRSATHVTHFIGVEFKQSGPPQSILPVSTISDIRFEQFDLSTIFCTGCTFGRTRAQRINDLFDTPQYHVGYVGGSGGLAVFDGTCSFPVALVENTTKSIITYETTISSKRRVIGETGVTSGSASASSSRSVDVQTAVNQTRLVRWLSGVQNRWELGADNAAESSTATGCDWYLNSYKNDGTYLDTPLSIRRSDSQVTLGGLVRTPGGVQADGSVRSNVATAIPAGGAAGIGFMLSSTVNFGIFFGSGAPTLSAVQGSLYLRTDPVSNVTRLYVNTNSATQWTGVNTVA